MKQRLTLQVTACSGDLGGAMLLTHLTFTAAIYTGKDEYVSLAMHLLLHVYVVMTGGRFAAAWTFDKAGLRDNLECHATGRDGEKCNFTIPASNAADPNQLLLTLLRCSCIAKEGSCSWQPRGADKERLQRKAPRYLKLAVGMVSAVSSKIPESQIAEVLSSEARRAGLAGSGSTAVHTTTECQTLASRAVKYLAMVNPVRPHT
jgi:hypothetical protein